MTTLLLPSADPIDLTAAERTKLAQLAAQEWNVSVIDARNIMSAIKHLVGMGEDITRVRERLNEPANTAPTDAQTDWQLNPKGRFATAGDLRRLQQSITKIAEWIRKHEGVHAAQPKPQTIGELCGETPEQSALMDGPEVLQGADIEQVPVTTPASYMHGAPMPVLNMQHPKGSLRMSPLPCEKCGESWSEPKGKRGPMSKSCPSCR